MGAIGIGQYRHVIGVANPSTPVPDGDGGYTEAWAPATPATIAAAIQAASTRDLERVTGGAVLTTATHLIRCRFHPQLSTLSRVTFRDRVFEVQSVSDVDARQVAMILICAEIISRPAAPATSAPPPPPAAGSWD